MTIAISHGHRPQLHPPIMSQISLGPLHLQHPIMLTLFHQDSTRSRYVFLHRLTHKMLFSLHKHHSYRHVEDVDHLHASVLPLLLYRPSPSTRRWRAPPPYQGSISRPVHQDNNLHSQHENRKITIKRRWGDLNSLKLINNKKVTKHILGNADHPHPSLTFPPPQVSSLDTYIIPQSLSPGWCRDLHTFNIQPLHQESLGMLGRRDVEEDAILPSSCM